MSCVDSTLFSKPRAYKSTTSSEVIQLKLCRKCNQRLVLEECKETNEFVCSRCSESLIDHYIINPLANALMAAKLF